MDQSKSNKEHTTKLLLPKRTFTLEFLVGLFTMAGVACIGYLAIGLGGLELWGPGKYDIIAQFDNISGLQVGASVEVAGVPVGQVSAIDLKDPVALVTLRLNKDFKVRDDDIASIRTKGIIGDRYVKISRGSSNTYINPGGNMSETESVVDIEDIIGKIVHSLGGEKGTGKE
ncbi:MAG: outer membrane lipid asymmetry maintenance protein MlaD [SAR324 cluster bacterium]|uniref:Outer membrane lipid asymmetry maintenance protein MlaD n=1 Tax=SAR324 cluster bacterium TaxID=2024889 RepID=A0A7X9FTT2_9DELT|nr:outer membrane lipid asymmetry maintenance protein MlaD [SAR324 cluster bacterium]